MNRHEIIKTGDVFCQIGVYLLTTMTVGQLFVDSIEWWMSFGFGTAGFMFIVFGIKILHYVPEENRIANSKMFEKADILINNAMISDSHHQKRKK